MKAAVTHGVQKVGIDEVPAPVPAADEVLVRVLAAGICGGDVRMYNGTFPYLNYPIINGHEFSGTVENIGSRVQSVSVGDYVTAEPLIPCGHCYACSIGKINCCSNLRVLGVHVDGCFAQYVCVKADRVYRLPNVIPPEDACMVEPYGIAMHALHRLQVVPGEPLLILGAGPIGLSALDIAKSTGMKAMISDVHPVRLEIARGLGADGIVNPELQDVKREAAAFTQGEGFPAVLEATGVPAVMETAQDYVANGGRICLAGVTDQGVTFSTMTFCNKEAAVFGTRNSAGVFPELIRLFAEKRLHPQALRTHTFPMEHYGEAIKMAAQRTQDVCKVIITMRADKTG